MKAIKAICVSLGMLIMCASVLMIVIGIATGASQLSIITCVFTALSGLFNALNALSWD